MRDGSKCALFVARPMMWLLINCIDFVARSATGSPRWARTDIFRNCTEKSWAMSCGFSCVSGYGSTASWLVCIVLLGPRGLTRLGDWDTALSKVTSSHFIYTSCSKFCQSRARKFIFSFLSGFVIFRIRVRRGGRKRPVPKGATYGKPKSHGVNQLKPTRNLQSIAEVSNNKDY